MEYDIYDIITKRDSEVAKIRSQIHIGEATNDECIMVQIEFQKEIEKIMRLNANFDY